MIAESFGEVKDLHEKSIGFQSPIDFCVVNSSKESRLLSDSLGFLVAETFEQTWGSETSPAQRSESYHILHENRPKNGELNTHLLLSLNITEEESKTLANKLKLKGKGLHSLVEYVEKYRKLPIQTFLIKSNYLDNQETIGGLIEGIDQVYPVDVETKAIKDSLESRKSLYLREMKSYLNEIFSGDTNPPIINAHELASFKGVVNLILEDTGCVNRLWDELKMDKETYSFDQLNLKKDGQYDLEMISKFIANRTFQIGNQADELSLADKSRYLKAYFSILGTVVPIIDNINQINSKRTNVSSKNQTNIVFWTSPNVSGSLYDIFNGIKFGISSLISMGNVLPDRNILKSIPGLSKVIKVSEILSEIQKKQLMQLSEGSRNIASNRVFLGAKIGNFLGKAAPGLKSNKKIKDDQVFWGSFPIDLDKPFSFDGLLAVIADPALYLLIRYEDENSYKLLLRQSKD